MVCKPSKGNDLIQHIVDNDGQHKRGDLGQETSVRCPH